VRSDRASWWVGDGRVGELASWRVGELAMGREYEGRKVWWYEGAKGEEAQTFGWKLCLSISTKSTIF